MNKPANNPLEHLIETWSNLDLPDYGKLTAREILEVLWLARQYQRLSDSPTQEQPPQVIKPPITPSPNDSTSPQTPPIDLTPSPSPSDIDIISNPSQSLSSSTNVVKIPVPDASILSEPLNLARALRPLMRRVASPVRQLLDEEATAEQMAEFNCCLPVFKPDSELWLDLALVVDESPSMSLWKTPVKELEQLVTHYGFFRNVRIFSLTHHESGKLILKPKTRSQNLKRESQISEIFPPNARRLILFVTDCVGEHWYKAEMFALLRKWLKSGSMAIIQMLPERLWTRTALSQGVFVRFGSNTSSLGNNNLLIKDILSWDDFDLETGLKIPVFTLESETASLWSGMITGRTDLKAPGFVFSVMPEENQILDEETADDEETDTLTASERVKIFRATASPLARKLASLLSASPVITLPIVRLIKKNILPKARQVHIAEVFLGGLLKPEVTLTPEVNPEAVNFDFIDEEIREIFLDVAPLSHSENVVEEISKDFAERLGMSLKEFDAFLRLPGKKEINGIELNAFARVKADILKRLGGKYAQLAEEIRKASLLDDNKELSLPVRLEKEQTVLLWQQGQTEIYSIWTRIYNSNLAFDAIVIPANDKGEFGAFGQDLFGFSTNVIGLKDALEQRKPSLITPEYPLLVPYQSSSWLIFATIDRKSAGANLDNLEVMIEAIIDVCTQRNFTQIVIPLFGTGARGKKFLAQTVIKIMLESLEKALNKFPNTSLKKIIFVELQEELVKLINQAAQQLINKKSKTHNSYSLQSFQIEPVTVNTEGEIIKRETKTAYYFREILPNDVPLDMVYIPGGTFMMGTTDEEIERLNKNYNTDYFSRERPQHLVTVPAFFMSKYPITQVQWRAICSADLAKGERASLPQVNRDLNPDPSEFKGNERPVEQVSWYDAVEFCQRLSRLTGRDYRLPSEAQWEYACRAGTTTPFYFGETITGELANYYATSTYANEPEGHYREETTPVGQFPPNAFGLYDMHGQVWEWCRDDWHDSYENAPSDGSAWLDDNDNYYHDGSKVTAHEKIRVLDEIPPLKKNNNDYQQDSISVLCGGSWNLIPPYCRCAYRNFNSRAYSHFFIGFRVMCVIRRT